MLIFMLLLSFTVSLFAACDSPGQLACACDASTPCSASGSIHCIIQQISTPNDCPAAMPYQTEWNQCHKQVTAFNSIEICDPSCAVDKYDYCGITMNDVPAGANFFLFFQYNNSCEQVCPKGYNWHSTENNWCKKRGVAERDGSCPNEGEGANRYRLFYEISSEDACRRGEGSLFSVSFLPNSREHCWEYWDEDEERPYYARWWSCVGDAAVFGVYKSEGCHGDPDFYRTDRSCQRNWWGSIHRYECPSANPQDALCIAPGGCDPRIELSKLGESTRSDCNLEDQSDDLSIATTSLKFDKERRVLYGSIALSNKKKISEATGVAVVYADVVKETNILFVRSVSQGRLSPGDELSGYGIPPMTRVKSFGTATGGMGTYQTTSIFEGTYAGITVTAVMNSIPEKYFLAAKIFNSKGRGSESKFRLGSGQFPLYNFDISHQSPENLTLAFQGVVPVEYNFKHIDSFKVKIKKGKMRVMSCAAYRIESGALIK